MNRTIAHITEFYAGTGENYIYEQALLTPGCSPVMLSEVKFISDFEPVKPFAYFRKQTRSMFLNRVLTALFRRFVSRFYFSRLGSFFAKEVEKSGSSLIHAHFGTMAVKALKAKRKTGLPMIVSFYGMDASEVLRDPFWIPSYQKMFHEVDLCVVLCEEVAQRLVAKGCPPSKIRLWDIGIPVDEYPYRKPIPSAQVKFLCVARFIEKKGHSVLLHAFKKALESHPTATLTLMGNGPLKGKIENLISDLNLESHVKLIDVFRKADFFDQFKLALSTHDIFVLPSVVASNGDDEGGPPVVLANAMAAGLPIISTPIAGISRAIVDNETGIMSRSGSADDLHKKMLYLIENQNLWEPLSKKARARAEEMFNLPRQIEKLRKIYDELLAERPSGAMGSESKWR